MNAMDRALAENIVTALRNSTDKRFIIRGLIKLRTDLVKNKSGIELFHNIGGIGHIMRFLTKPNEQIIEVCLSILANCCTIAACCREIFELKICKTIWNIIKSVDNDVMQMRAFRLLGNLAKYNTQHLLSQYNIPSFSKDLCKILSESKSVASSIMVYRACRFLLCNSQFLKDFLEAGGFMLLIGAMNAIVKKLDAKVDDSHVGNVAGDKTILYRRLEKPHQLVHREKYFEEVMRNLNGSRNDSYDVDYEQEKPTAKTLYSLPEDSVTRELLQEILKCLKIVADCKIQDWRILKNLYEKKIPSIMWDGNSRPEINLAPLIYLITFENFSRNIALNIVKNLSKCCFAACWLVEAKVVSAVCELLQVGSDIHLSRYDRCMCINILSNLSNDSCNRAKIRRSGAISSLIKIMQTSGSQTEISAIIYLFNNYQFDELSLRIMLKEGLLPLLIRELNVFLKSNVVKSNVEPKEKTQISKKRKLEHADIASMIKLSKLKVNEQINCNSGDSSPMNSMSPCSSRSISPEFTSAFIINENEDDNFYSPVCSDAEDEDEIKVITVNTEIKQETTEEPLNALLGLLDVAGGVGESEDLDKSFNTLGNHTSDDNDNEDDHNDRNDDDDDDDENMTRARDLRCSDIDGIEHLLLRITLLSEKRWELCSEDSITTFIKAIEQFGCKSCFSASLTNILMVTKFFDHVVKVGIPYQLYQLHRVNERDGLGFLQTLSHIGESSYGKAVMTGLLESRNILHRNRAVISIAFIIKNPALLYEFVKLKDVFEKILKIIFNESTADDIICLKREAVDALTCMSRHTLNIPLPITFIKSANDDYDVYIDDNKPLHEICDMVFILHPDQAHPDPITVVDFNKQLLCDSSDVFSTMLNSDFREGQEGAIHLYDYSKSGVCYFLNLIVRRTQGLTINAPTIKKSHIILQALELSRIYILPDLELALCNLLIKKFNAKNCFLIFDWSLRNYHTQLRDMSVNYFLSSTLLPDEKIVMFQQAMNSGVSQQWEHLLRETLHAPLQHFSLDGKNKNFISFL